MLNNSSTPNNSLTLLLETLRSQQQLSASGGSGSQGQQMNGYGQLGQFPLGQQRGNFQIGANAVQHSSQGQATQQNQQMQTVFIGDLPKDVSMVELYEYIKSVAGECDLVLKRPQMKYFYYAFARFGDILDARKLLEEVKFPELHGKTCRALPYDKDLLRSVQAEGNIFVKGFGDKWTHKELHEAFKGFGDVVSARVSIEEGHKSRGFGFVQYRKPDSAAQAVEEMNGKKYEDLGFELVVGPFKTPHERGSSVAGNSTSTTALFSKKFNNLFVKNFPKPDYTSEELQSLFEPFGEIVSCKVFETDLEAEGEEEDEENKQAARHPSTLQRGYGFVCFAQCEDARKALEHFHEKGDESSVSIDLHSTSRGGMEDSTVHHQQVAAPKLYVVPALKRELREAYIRMRTLKYKKQMARQNLYFRGFPVDSAVSVEDTEKELVEFFQTFGEVSNIKLMLARKPQSSKDVAENDDSMLGFGFVCYKSVEDAQRARVEASKRPFRGNSLYISQFETKEQRKAHMLERIDQIEFARYKKREEVKKDMDKLGKLSDDLRSEQGQLLLTLLKLLAQLSQQKQKMMFEQRISNGGVSAPPAQQRAPYGYNRQRMRRAPYNSNSQQQQQQQSQQSSNQPQMNNVQQQLQHQMPLPSNNQPVVQQSPQNDIRQHYQQGLASMLNSPQFISVDEPTQRNLIGTFIYPYIDMILRQATDQLQQRMNSDSMSPMTAKATGMIIQIPNITQMLMACQTLDTLAHKSREAVQLIQQAEANQVAALQAVSSSTTTSH